jgi:Ca2+-binding EF-hand superfamily protein
MFSSTRIFTTAMLAFAAASLATSALAQQPAAAPEARPGGGRVMMRHLDTDGDGTITLEEFEAVGERNFARMDADGDGRISAEDMNNAREDMMMQHRQQRAPDAQGDARGGGQRGQGGGKGAAPDREQHRQQIRAQRFAHMDADGDGYISKAEFEQRRKERFSALDANGNGAIEAEELPQHQGRRMHGGNRNPVNQDKRD